MFFALAAGAALQVVVEVIRYVARIAPGGLRSGLGRGRLPRGDSRDVGDRAPGRVTAQRVRSFPSAPISQPVPPEPHDRTALVHPLDDVLPGEARVFEAARSRSPGRRRAPAALSPFLGPAFIAAVAYVDPGNFATNMAGGAKFGYLLLWVVLGRT